MSFDMEQSNEEKGCCRILEINLMKVLLEYQLRACENIGDDCSNLYEQRF